MSTQSNLIKTHVILALVLHYKPCHTPQKLGGELGGVTMQDPRTFLKGFDNSKIESLKIGIFS